jgi:hypothetical protein
MNLLNTLCATNYLNHPGTELFHPVSDSQLQVIISQNISSHFVDSSKQFRRTYTLNTVNFMFE